MGEVPSREELEAAHCWEADDRVPGRPGMTAFRRGLRLHQARWREAQGHPIGSQPIVPREGGRSRLVGSRLPLDHARATGANFVTAPALATARARTSTKEPHQTLDAQRLWADLLSSPALCLNLFGALAADHRLADRALRTWWPDLPGEVTDVRFLHSPGRLDPAYLGNLLTLDAAFTLDLGDGDRGILGVVTRYHDRAKAEKAKPERLGRYVEVTERSGRFVEGAVAAADGTDLLVTWLQHLLVLSMLQLPGGPWRWGRLMLVHPAGNTDVAEIGARYQDLLVDDATFRTATLEDLLDVPALPEPTAAALRDRYVTS